MSVPNCQICGHPDYLPSGCCHWHVIRGIEKERDATQEQLQESAVLLEQWITIATTHRTAGLSLAKTGMAMREAQKEYFKTKSKAALIRSKELEKALDAMHQEVIGNGLQPGAGVEG